MAPRRGETAEANDRCRGNGCVRASWNGFVRAFTNRNPQGAVLWLMLATAAGVGVFLLFLPPVIGMADNGDFARVMHQAGLTHLDPRESYEERYFRYAHIRFAFADPAWGGYVSSHVILVNVAAWIGRMLDGRVFDIRILGACYLALLLAAFALIVRHAPATGERRVRDGAPLVTAAVLAAALVFVFGDVGYLAYFNSFYGEPYALVGMLLLAGAALALAAADRPSGSMLALLTAAAFAVATSKIQNAPLGLAFVLLFVRLFTLHRGRRWRGQVTAGLAAVALGSLAMLAFAPDGLRHINLYQTVFYGILKDSPSVSEDLRELGIPEKYAVLAGTNYFQKDTAIPQDDPALRRDVLEKLGHADVALFYLRHPDRLLRKLERAAENGVYIRPAYLGNYDREAGKPPGALARSFSGWSRLKPHLPHTLPWVAGFYALYGLALAGCWMRLRSPRARLVAETLAVVWLAGMFSFVVPVIGDGEADLAKHLFMFNVCSDMMIVSTIAVAARAVARPAGIRRRGAAETAGESGRRPPRQTD